MKHCFSVAAATILLVFASACKDVPTAPVNEEPRELEPAMLAWGKAAVVITPTTGKCTAVNVVSPKCSYAEWSIVGKCGIVSCVWPNSASRPTGSLSIKSADGKVSATYSYTGSPVIWSEKTGPTFQVLSLPMNTSYTISGTLTWRSKENIYSLTETKKTINIKKTFKTGSCSLWCPDYVNLGTMTIDYGLGSYVW